MGLGVIGMDFEDLDDRLTAGFNFSSSLSADDELESELETCLATFIADASSSEEEIDDEDDEDDEEEEEEQDRVSDSELLFKGGKEADCVIGANFFSLGPLSSGDKDEELRD